MVDLQSMDPHRSFRFRSANRLVATMCAAALGSSACRHLDREIVIPTAGATALGAALGVAWSRASCRDEVSGEEIPCSTTRDAHFAGIGALLGLSVAVMLVAYALLAEPHVPDDDSASDYEYDDDDDEEGDGGKSCDHSRDAPPCPDDAPCARCID